VSVADALSVGYRLLILAADDLRRRTHTASSMGLGALPGRVAEGWLSPIGGIATAGTHRHRDVVAFCRLRRLE